MLTAGFGPPQLLGDKVKIQQVRAKALANRNKYSGVSADDMRQAQGIVRPGASRHVLYGLGRRLTARAKPSSGAEIRGRRVPNPRHFRTPPIRVRMQKRFSLKTWRRAACSRTRLCPCTHCSTDATFTPKFQVKMSRYGHTTDCPTVPLVSPGCCTLAALRDLLHQDRRRSFR